MLLWAGTSWRSPPQPLYTQALFTDAAARPSTGSAQQTPLAIQACHSVLCLLCPAAWQLLSVQRSLTAYYDRFKGVLNPVNADNIQRLLLIASALHKCLQHQQQTPQERQQQQQHASAAVPSSSSSSSGGRVTTVNDLLFDLSLDTFNMFELAHWVRDNKMAFKVGMLWLSAGKGPNVHSAHLHTQPTTCQLAMLCP